MEAQHAYTTADEPRIMVFGVGRMGSIHAEKLEKLGALAGVYDLDHTKAQEIAKKYHTKTNPDEDEYDGMVVAVPPGHHHTAALGAIYRKKHVLVEKPFTADVQTAGELCTAAETQQVFLDCAFVEDFNPANVAIQEIIDLTDQHIDTLSFQRLAPYAVWREGFVVWDIGIHDVHLAHRMLGPPRHVEAVRSIHKGHDNITVRMKFDKADANFAWAHGKNIRHTRTMSVYTDKRIDYTSNMLTGEAYCQGEAMRTHEHDAVEEELHAFIQAIQNANKYELSECRLALNTVRICEAIQTSISEKRGISLEGLD